MSPLLIKVLQIGIISIYNAIYVFSEEGLKNFIPSTEIKYSYRLVLSKSPLFGLNRLAGFYGLRAYGYDLLNIPNQGF